MRSFLLTLLLSTLLFSYQDSDLDGVEDAKDRCPNSSFDTLVNAQGCEDTLGISLSAGYSFSSGSYGTTDTYITHTGSFNLGYTKEALSLFSSISYMNSGTSVSTVTGLGDVYVGGSYAFSLSKASTLVIQPSAKIATANTTFGTGVNDYGITATFALAQDAISSYVLAGYTFVGDTTTIDYNDLLTLSAGAGYTMNALYLSLGYSYISAYTADNVESHSIVLNANYALSNALTSSLSYSYGLSSAVPQHTVSFLLGTSF